MELFSLSAIILSATRAATKAYRVPATARPQRAKSLQFSGQTRITATIEAKTL